MVKIDTGADQSASFSQNLPRSNRPSQTKQRRRAATKQPSMWGLLTMGGLTCLRWAGAAAGAPLFAGLPVPGSGMLRGGPRNLDNARALPPAHPFGPILAPGDLAEGPQINGSFSGKMLNPNAATYDGLRLYSNVAAGYTGGGHQFGSPDYDVLRAVNPDDFAESLCAPPAAIISVPLYGCPTADYSAPYTMGNETFLGIIDSGSSNVGVQSDECVACAEAGGYAPGPTAAVEQLAVSAYYGSGNWTGIVVQDLMSLGSGPLAPVVFGDITAEDDFFLPNNCQVGTQGPSINQGIIGMGPLDLLTSPLSSYISTISEQLPANAFSIAVCDDGGLLALGGLLTSSVTATPLFTPMVAFSNSPYYAVAGLAIALGGVDTGITINNLGPTVMDTGTSALVFPDAVVNFLASQIETVTQGAISAAFLTNGGCVSLAAGVTAASINANAPSFSMTFYSPSSAGGEFTLTNQATDSYLLLQSDSQGNTYACSLLQGSGSGDTALTIFGNTAMRGYTLLFDLEQFMVGIAPSTVCT